MSEYFDSIMEIWEYSFYFLRLWLDKKSREKKLQRKLAVEKYDIKSLLLEKYDVSVENVIKSFEGWFKILHNQIFLKPKVIYIYYDFKHELIFSSVEYVIKILFSVEKEKRKKKEENLKTICSNIYVAFSCRMNYSVLSIIQSAVFLQCWSKWFYMWF